MDCLIIDDEKHAIDILVGHVTRTPDLNLVYHTSVATEGLSFLRDNKVDLIFLDIEMPEMTGMDVLKLLSQYPLQNNPFVILTTAYSDYAVQSYEYNVVDYIMKPITYQRFLKALNKIDYVFKNSSAPPATNKQTEDFFLVKTGVKGKMIKINFEDIEYIEGLKNYVSICANGRKIPVLYNMSDMEKILANRHFMRIHRSFIINLKLIAGIEGNEVMLPDDKKLSIGVSYREEFFKAIDDKILRK